jgi:hypothetical protein
MTKTQEAVDAVNQEQITKNTATENQQLANVDTAANRFLTAADQAGGSDPLLKFTKGHYYVGDDEVPTNDCKYVALMSGVSYGWVKFVDKKVVDQRIGRISEGFVAESRETLGDTDQTQWELDSHNEPRDPWVLQWYLPLVNTETGEGVVFVTGSTADGAPSAIYCAHTAAIPTRVIPP